MRILLACLMIATLPSIGLGQFEKEQTEGKGVRYGNSVTQRWQVGVKIQAVAGTVKGLFITVPIPTDWPEQTVKFDDEDFTRNVGKVTYRFLDGGVKQMVVTVPFVRTGDEARAVITMEVESKTILPPKDTTLFKIPRKVPRNLLKFLGTSPYINSRHSKIRNQSKELIKDSDSTWDKAKAINMFVKTQIELGLDSDPINGALETLRSKKGNGEDRVNLAVALYRAAKIPSRYVWIQGGYFAEIYLHDDDGKGHWIPSDVIGNSEFGGYSFPKPVLQKGDNIKVPEYKERLRYVPELVKGKKGGGKPKVTFVRELLPAPR